ncbi:MAG: hypothetical protein RLZZ301_1309 [Bacteroidota bacterium]|jgi:hypothetical protein
MATFIQTSGGYLRSTRVTYWSIFAVQTIVALFAFLVNYHKPVDFGKFHPDDIMAYFIPTIALGGLIASQLVFKSRVKIVSEKSQFKQKLDCYKAALMIRFSLLEGPNLMVLAAYFFTDNPLYLGMAILSLVIYLSVMPGVHSISKDLHLSAEDSANLANPSYPLA